MYALVVFHLVPYLNQFSAVFRNRDKMIGYYDFEFEHCLFEIIYTGQSSTNCE